MPTTNNRCWYYTIALTETKIKFEYPLEYTFHIIDWGGGGIDLDYDIKIMCCWNLVLEFCVVKTESIRT
jgi:hypothetical protein